MSSLLKPQSANQISFQEWLANQAGDFATRQDAWSVWLAAKLYELAGEADFLRAENPLEFDARHDAVMREVYR